MTIIEISVTHSQPSLLDVENLYEPQKLIFLPLCSFSYSHIANTRQPMTSKLSYYHDILQKIVLGCLPTPPS